MASSSENKTINPSEFVDPKHRSISPPLTDNIDGIPAISGVSGVIVPDGKNKSLLSPTYLIFDKATGLSNGYSTMVSGITDFTAYNDYIHYTPIGGLVRINVYNSLIKATSRFEIYSRQYRT